MSYKAPKLFFNPHVETIFPALFRKIKEINYTRERIITTDNDFLDLDWVEQNYSRVVIISHGLEGSSDRPYVRGMARIMAAHNFDVIAWNFRGCSGEINKQLRFYHSGATEDLELVVAHARNKGYKEIYLVGFSLGANLTLKYLGETARDHSNIIKCVVFSVPLDLHASSLKIDTPGNMVYARRFLNNLKHKVLQKARHMPHLSTDKLKNIKTLKQFDDAYTAPLHGFKSAIHYYQSCSAINFLASIKIPTLIVNAKNDPFLTAECFPFEVLKNHKYVSCEYPVRGGHVGFAEFNKARYYWSEKRALAFFEGKK